MGIDPVYSRYPMRSFPCDLAIQGDSSVVIQRLTEAASRRVAGRESELGERRRVLEEAHRKQRATWRATMEKAMDASPLDPLWISHCIGRIKDPDTLVFNEYDLDPTQLDFTDPGSFFGNPSAGGLGWALGAAIGAKLAAPQKTVVATVGDGSYLFGNPTPAHFVSRSLGAPTLTVIFNNSAWNAVRLATLRMYPDGWAARSKEMPLSRLEPSPDFELLVTACGGYGERVEKPGEVMPALKRALRVVREEKRSAVLNMICKPPGP
jgi:acetolactate synthase-1/2/3 large subunit